MNVAVYRFKKIFFVVILALYFFSSQPIFASDTDGTIPVNSYAWGENLSWINFGLSTGNIHVTNTAITGYAWSQNYGWINMSPTNGGVTNNNSGTLGGNAWSSGLGGWIPFDGVTINSSGKFTGIAGIATSTVGRINFDCTNCNVTTDWRPNFTSTSTTNTVTTTTSTTSEPATVYTPTPTSSYISKLVGAKYAVPILVSLSNLTTTRSAFLNINKFLSDFSYNNLVFCFIIIALFLFLIIILFISRIHNKTKRRSAKKFKL